MPLPRAFGPVLALVLSYIALPALADDRAIAQQAFEQARALMAAGRVAEACPKFAAAAQLSPTAGVRLNLSDCYAKLGKTASAWSKADEALALAERVGDVVAADFARQRKAALAPKLAYLTITIEPQDALDVEVKLDGEKLPDAVWDTALPIDPGEHVLTVRAPGYRTWSSKATVRGEGTRKTVQVPRLGKDIETSGPNPTSISPMESEAPSSGLRTAGFVLGGVGIVGLGVGTALGLMVGSKKSAYEEHQDKHGRCLDQDCVTLSQDALSMATGSTIAFIAGGALVATGAILWLVAPTKDDQSEDKPQELAVALVPWGGADGLGGGLVGKW